MRDRSWAAAAAVLLALPVLALAVPLPPGGHLVRHQVGQPQPAAGATAVRTGSSGGYSHVQFVGFPIQTGYNDYIGPNHLIMSNEGEGAFEDAFGVYVGLEDARADMAGRLAIMKAAVAASLGSAELDPRNSTLKIFMAPEFFWRGPTGAYGVDNPALLELGDRLRDMVAARRFEDWLFVFGSVIGSTAVQQAGPAGGNTVWDTYNFAVIQRGNSTERHTHFKTHISGIDFLQSVPGRADAIVYSNMNLNTPDLNKTVFINGTEFHVPMAKDNIDMRYPALPAGQLPGFENKMGSVVNGSFTMAGLDFCLDLCLDHALGVCAQALDEEKARGGRGEVDVQLIVSAGMSIIPENTRVPMGGSVLLCDGLSSGAQQLIRKFGDRQLGGHVHAAVAEEARQLSQVQLKHFLIADHTTAAGHLHPANASVFSKNDWRNHTLRFFAAQKYALKHKSSGGGPPEEAGGAALEQAKDYVFGTEPLDYVFPPVSTSKSSCDTEQRRLCNMTLSGGAQACEACAGVHALELVSAGCEDAQIVSFCSD